MYALTACARVRVYACILLSLLPRMLADACARASLVAPAAPSGQAAFKILTSASEAAPPALGRAGHPRRERGWGES